MNQIQLHFEPFQKALKKLKEAITLGDSEIVRDGTIQRFEFTFELAWKLMKRINEKAGLESNSPREAIKQAFKIHCISDNLLWLDSLEYRNLVSHTYSEETAQKIYDHITDFIPLFEELEKNVQKKIEEKEL